MAIVPSLAMVSPQVNVGQNEICMLTVRNTGGSDVTISSISTYLIPAAASGFCGQVQFAPGSTMVVPASGSLSLPFSVVLNAPTMAGMGLAATAASTKISATVYSNDATTAVAETPAIVVVPAPALALGQNQNPTSPGWLDFTQSANSYMTLF